MNSTGRMTRIVSCCGQASQRWQMAKEKIKMCSPLFRCFTWNKKPTRRHRPQTLFCQTWAYFEILYCNKQPGDGNVFLQTLIHLWKESGKRCFSITSTLCLVFSRQLFLQLSLPLCSTHIYSAFFSSTSGHRGAHVTAAEVKSFLTRAI